MRIVAWSLAGPGTAPIIGDALRSVAPLVDGSIVVLTTPPGPDDQGIIDAAIDATGARDGVLQIRSWLWRNDFAAARNIANDMAAEPWLGRVADFAVMVDADEAAICPDPAALRSWLAALPPEIAVVLVHAADGSHTRERLFRLPSRYRFTGRTHEMYPAHRDEQAIAPPELITWTELAKTREQLRAKFFRDVDMLREDIREHPRNGAAHYYLGISLQSLALYASEDGDAERARALFTEAIDAYREHRRIDTGGAPAWHEGTAFSCFRAAECYLALEQPDRALDCAAAGMVLDAGIAELPWIAAVGSFQGGRPEQAKRWAEIAKVHGKGSEAERARVGFRVQRGLTTGPDEILRAVGAGVHPDNGKGDRMRIDVSPDGAHYLNMARGLRVPMPYARRFLLPWLLGPHPERWRALTLASFAALPIFAALFFSSRGLAGWPLAFAVALLCAQPGLRLPLRFPVLLDAPSFAGALAVAWSAGVLPWWATVPLALLLGATRENAPVFAACWAWSPLPLVGLLVVGWWRPSVAPSPAEPWLAHPWREAWALRRRIGLDGSLYLRPFGAALAGLAAAPSWQTVATVALAFGQCAVAMDTIRLTVWAAPVLVLGAAQVLPPAWWVLALVWTAVHRDDARV